MITFNTCQLSFKANVIDVHAHVGKHIDTQYTKDMLDVFVKQPLPNNDTVEKMIVSDTDTFKGVGLNEYDGNKKALQSFNGDKSYAFLASCCPKNGNIKDIEKLLQEFPDDFVGLKFHPNDNNLAVTDDKYKPYFEYANKNKIPCMFHTCVPVDGNGRMYRLPDDSLDVAKLDPFGDPGAIYSVAKKYKDAPFIMAHMGGGWNESHDRAIDVLVESVRNGDANLYADISWVDIDAQPVVDGRAPKDHIVKAIKKLKGIGDSTWDKGDQSFRLMFGTDAPIARFKEATGRDAYSKFIDEIKTAIRQDKDLAKDAEKIIEDLFYNNAKKLFFPETLSQAATAAAENVKKSGGCGKIVGSVIAGIGVISGAAYLLNKNNHNKKQL